MLITYRNYLSFAKAPILLGLDIILLSTLERPLFHCQLLGLLGELFGLGRIHQLIALLIGMGSFDVLIFGRFGVSWLYAVPLATLIWRYRAGLAAPLIFQVLALIIALLIHTQMLYGWLLNAPASGWYTGTVICGNIGILILKFFMHGRPGNRRPHTSYRRAA